MWPLLLLTMGAMLLLVSLVLPAFARGGRRPTNLLHATIQMNDAAYPQQEPGGSVAALSEREVQESRDEVLLRLAKLEQRNRELEAQLANYSKTNRKDLPQNSSLQENGGGKNLEEEQGFAPSLQSLF